MFLSLTIIGVHFGEVPVVFLDSSEGGLAPWVTCEMWSSDITVSVQLYPLLVMCAWACFFTLDLPICKMDIS